MQKLLEKINLKSALLIGTLALTASWSNAQQKHPAEPEMVFVQGGTLSDFNIGKYPVTQKQWKLIMGDNPSENQGDNYPVTNVSYGDAHMFISRLNERTGKKYRLPTEAEWQYAAHGGNQSKGYIYSGSNNINDVAWYKGNSDDRIHTVGTKMPNELGIYDMSGNVMEWCSDKLLSGDIYYVHLGGDYCNGEDNCRVPNKRLGNKQYEKFSNVGFRLVLP